MKPTLVLVGRPNVGKSTLFNRLTKTRDALVADFPGLTRDRRYGLGRVAEREFLVVDTAGFDPVFGARPLKRAIQSQIENPLAKAILEGRFAAKDTIRISCVGGVMRFEKGG